MRVYGGEGNDLLRTGGRDDLLDGGPGDDNLSALEGNDVFDEASQMNGADVINGGEGLDTLSYSRRIEPLDVTLCTAPSRDGCPTPECTCEARSGEADEADTIVNVESVRSGTGNDRLVGTDGDDFLYGDEGDDVIEGLNGSDVLQGGPGRDELFGGEDADICDAEPEEAVDSCEI
jgi:Ca2+-binding RTX toxin-like protein